MALEKDFLTMTNDTITIADPTTASKYGAHTFGTASSGIPTYLEIGTRVVIDAQGVEQTATGMLFVMSSSVSISPQSKVTLGDGQTPEILRVDVLRDEEGQHHLEVSYR